MAKIESLQDRCLEALRRVDHTLAVHGKIDAETPLHKLIQDILYPGAPNEDPSGQRREASEIGWMGDIGGNPFGPFDR